MQAPKVFIGRQPIVDERERTVAYELLFRASAAAQHAEIQDRDLAVLQVVANTFMSLGPQAVLGSNRGFFNVTPRMLMSDLIEALPKDRVVIEILEDVSAGSEILQRCRDLRRLGFQLALDDYVADDAREPLLGLVDIVKVDLSGVKKQLLRPLVRALRSVRVVLLAEKVETRDEFERCRTLGFERFQGFYFARPAVLEGQSVDADETALLDLLQKIQCDAGTPEIIDVLKHHAHLSVNLLRFANSAGVARMQKVGSVTDALVYMGRRQLRRWVSILLFASGSGGLESPLLITAVHRGRLLELLSKRLPGAAADAELPDRAFLVGMLSLIDAVLGRPKQQVLEELNLEDDAREALLAKEGPLGALLELAEALEGGNFSRLEAGLRALAIADSDFQQDEHAAYRWVHELIREVGV